MDKCNVGDRVQIYDDGGVKDGVVVKITPATKDRPEDYWRASDEERKEFTDRADVKWDDGTESQVLIDELDPEDTEMERDFRKAVHYAEDQIQAKLDEASAALSEATKIAERYGVPFRSGVSPVSNQYFPRSLKEKFADLSDDFVNTVSDTYNEYETTGWRHSAVC